MASLSFIAKKGLSQAKRGLASAKGSLVARNVERFGPNMGEKVASNLPPLSTNLFAKPIARHFPGSQQGLTGAALKAQNKEIRRSTNNLFLGARANWLGEAIVGTAAVGGIAVSQASREFKREATGDPYSSVVEPTGNLPRMNADFIGGVEGGKRDDLGATGDLVLALNRRR